MKSKIIILVFLIALIAVGCAPKPPKDLVLLKDTVQVKFDKHPALVGQIKNQGNKDLQLRSISVTVWRDAKRDWIKDAGVTWFAQSVSPDGTVNFEVAFPDLKKADDLSIYSYELRWFDQNSSRILTRKEDV
jgi:hypothetical protein